VFGCHLVVFELCLNVFGCVWLRVVWLRCCLVFVWCLFGVCLVFVWCLVVFGCVLVVFGCVGLVVFSCVWLCWLCCFGFCLSV
jgi:hypothetical protein